MGDNELEEVARPVGSGSLSYLLDIGNPQAQKQKPGVITTHSPFHDFNVIIRSEDTNPGISFSQSKKSTQGIQDAPRAPRICTRSGNVF